MIWGQKNNFFFFGSTAGVWTQGLMFAKQALYPLSHIYSPFCSGYFGDGVSWTAYSGWPQTVILLISASQAARIIGMSHQHLAIPALS
jgi:hypothetical protein